ncbi:hypothetical protein EPD60_00930 [Flaviaesturariibacter flavus]|uniref:Uncharacterized protein n=1 Tax=Flaviaesturariibacter flavus TaxID=2502780 RepID=A0A4R1BN53_9BACT|nr:hypothetical protein [Flaviaesturariibacter flavus]TCJ19010.1 hypothetical protein EPD60_00930 [Flaviaesturariibacter flavus]
MKIQRLLLSMLLLSVCAAAQEKALVTWQNGAPRIVNKIYRLPFALHFSRDFAGKRLALVNAGNNDTVVAARFGSADLGTFEGTGEYRVPVVAPGTAQLLGNSQPFSDTGFRIFIDGKALPVTVRFTRSAAVPGDEVAARAYRFSYQPGSVVLDALKLRELQLAGGSRDSVQAFVQYILRAYDLEGSNSQENVYISRVLGPLLVEKGAAQSGGGLINNVLSSVGNVDVTGFADGLARFIVKRTKQELSMAFFQRFRERLDSLPDLKGVFPETHQLLMAIDQQVYDYNSYINNLRAGFRSDLLRIDERLPAVVTNHPAYFGANVTNFSLGLALRSGCYVSSSLRKDMHPGDVLESFPMEYFAAGDSSISGRLAGLRGGLQALQLLSYSCRETDTARHRYWVGMDDFRGLTRDKQSLQLFLGLLIEVAKGRYGSVAFGGGTNLYGLLNDPLLYEKIDRDLTTLQAFRNFLLRFGGRVSDLNGMAGALNAAIGDSAHAEVYVKYFNACTDLLETGFTALELPGLRGLPDAGEVHGLAASWLGVARQASDLSSAIVRKRYAEAVNALVGLYGNVLRLSSPPVVDTVAARTTPMLMANAAEPGTRSTLNAFVRYGSVMVGLVEARNSEEVAAVIEAAVLPPGSARVKRTMPVSISLNAYCGLFSGNEVILGLDDNRPFSRWNAFGVAAPVGVAYSEADAVLPWPLSRVKALRWKGASASWFVSVLDLGAVAAFRFGDNTTEQVPTIRLRDIFSPGIFWSVGLPRSPLSVNLGIQTGPNLRTVKAAGNDLANGRYVRYSAALCVDLPLLNLK